MIDVDQTGLALSYAVVSSICNQLKLVSLSDVLKKCFITGLEA